jgi:archaellum biogenesis ATPase FlaH
MPDEYSRRDDWFIPVNDVEPAEWLIEGLAVEQGISILFGDTGVGKTTLSLQLLHALMSRQDMVLGLKVKPVRGFIVEQDVSPMVFRNHRDRVLEHLPGLADLKIPRKFVTWDDRSHDLTDLVQLIKAYPAKLVIIDSVTSLGIPDINHPNTSMVLDRLRRISTDEECSFILLHHVNKKGLILGSITLQIKADSIVELTKKGLKFHKTRGQLPHLPDDILPIKRWGTDIIFRLSMKFRAKMLANDRTITDEQALAILQEEYPDSTRGSIRATLSRARNEATRVESHTDDA